MLRYDREDWPLWFEQEIMRAGTALWYSDLPRSVRRHVRDGFVRRHAMIQECRMWIGRHCAADRMSSLEISEATTAQIYINALYLNIRGALDNLAWALNYRYNLFQDVSEDNARGRAKIDLFHRDFRRALAVHKCKTSRRLDALHSWGRELADRRDPAAHRVPLYVPPGVIQGDEALEEFQRLDALAGRTKEQRGGESRLNLLLRARQVAKFAPVVIVTNADGMRVYGIHGLVWWDLRRYFRAARAALAGLA